jgi:hypothetical protein
MTGDENLLLLCVIIVVNVVVIFLFIKASRAALRPHPASSYTKETATREGGNVTEY